MANEKRLIDANALKAQFPVIGKIAEDLWYGAAIRVAIDRAPTIDAVEVVHGRWEHRPDKRICSLCNYRYSYFGGKDYNYCPNCGADMREREDND